MKRNSDTGLHLNRHAAQVNKAITYAGGYFIVVKVANAKWTWIWRCHLKNGGHCVSVSICWVQTAALSIIFTRSLRYVLVENSRMPPRIRLILGGNCYCVRKYGFPRNAPVVCRRWPIRTYALSSFKCRCCIAGDKYLIIQLPSGRYPRHEFRDCKQLRKKPWGQPCQHTWGVFYLMSLGCAVSGLGNMGVGIFCYQLWNKSKGWW